ncbi:MAG: nucleotidyltransferase family protein [Nitrospirae bacterium]|nr:nucleotidyltransferase family protein [Nitrospirota bacterium]
MDNNIIKNLTLKVLERHNVQRASLFGSFARGEQVEGSDIDLLVELSGQKSLLDLVGLKLELQEVLDMKVDVLTFDSIYPPLRESILNEQDIIL